MCARTKGCGCSAAFLSITSTSAFLRGFGRGCWRKSSPARIGWWRTSWTPGAPVAPEGRERWQPREKRRCMWCDSPGFVSGPEKAVFPGGGRHSLFLCRAACGGPESGTKATQKPPPDKTAPCATGQQWFTKPEGESPSPPRGIGDLEQDAPATLLNPSPGATGSLPPRERCPSMPGIEKRGDSRKYAAGAPSSGERVLFKGANPQPTEMNASLQLPVVVQWFSPTSRTRV
jgi:hypothetical protein